MPLPPASASSTAVVTGASSGIGEQLARELARRGHGVTLVARREGRLRELAAELASAHGIRAEIIAADVSEAAGRDRIVAALAERELAAEILVNNAGIGTMGLFHTLAAEREVALVRLNVEAVVALCAALVPAMVARGHGAVLNLGSSLAFQPVPRQATYSASKAFVLTFTEALRMDLAGTGVTATALCPGPVRTGFAGLIESSPGMLFSSVEEVARAGVDGLARGRATVIPGAGNRGGAILGRHLPRPLYLRLAPRLWPK